MAVSGVIGYPGAGKTFWLAWWGVRERIRRRVYANFRLEGSRYFTWEEFRLGQFERGALVLIDEIGRWLNARDWQHADRDVLLLFAQHRKRGFDLLWSAQRWMDVDVAVRELTPVVRLAVGPWPNEDWAGIFRYDVMRRRLLEEGWERVRAEWFVARRSVMRAFDTFEVIGRPSRVEQCRKMSKE